MTILELANCLSEALKQGASPNDEVYITTKELEPSLGARPKCGTKYAGLGFDWEQGEFRIQPAEDLRKIKHEQWTSAGNI